MSIKKYIIGWNQRLGQYWNQVPQYVWEQLGKLVKRNHFLEKKNLERKKQAIQDHNRIVELEKELLYVKNQNKNKRDKIKSLSKTTDSDES